MYALDEVARGRQDEALFGANMLPADPDATYLMPSNSVGVRAWPDRSVLADFHISKDGSGGSVSGTVLCFAVFYFIFSLVGSR